MAEHCMSLILAQTRSLICFTEVHSAAALLWSSDVSTSVTVSEDATEENRAYITLSSLVDRQSRGIDCFVVIRRGSERWCRNEYGRTCETSKMIGFAILTFSQKWPPFCVA